MTAPLGVSIVEGLRRKPIQPEKENLIHLAVFILLIALMLIITTRYCPDSFQVQLGQGAAK